MARARQVAGGIVLAVTTIAVTAGAVYALWLGAPLLNPGGDRFGAKDIPIINTDARIVRPLPPANTSPRAGVIQPAPQTSKPKPIAVSHKTRAKRPNVTIARTPVVSRRPAASRPVEVASAGEGDSGRSIPARHPDDSRHPLGESD